MNENKRKETEKRRSIARLIEQAMRIDSDVIGQLWKIFDYDTGRDVYRIYELFLQIYTKEDALEAAIIYGLKYF